MGTKGNRKYIQMDYYEAQKNCKTYLESIKDGSTRMTSKLTNYCESTKGKLEGKAFDIMRGRLGVYSNVFSYMGNALDILTNNIVSSNNNVCNVMGGNSEISDEDIEELEEKIRNSNSLIYTTKKGLEGVLEGDKKAAQESLLNQYKNTLAELRAEKTRLETLLDSVEGADSSGLSSLGDVEAKIDMLKSKMMY